MAEIRFTKDHEWVSLDGAVATVGITGHAQDSLGDVVFVELPEPGRTVTQGEACAVVESVKAASDVYAPLDGEVVEHNAAIVEDPALINREPEAGGWFFRMRLADVASFAGLLDSAAYASLVEETA